MLYVPVNIVANLNLLMLFVIAGIVLFLIFIIARALCEWLIEEIRDICNISSYRYVAEPRKNPPTWHLSLAYRMGRYVGRHRGH